MVQGGPGSTGLYGLLKEHGPVKADVDPTGLPFIKKNPYSWSKNHSVIYVDNPVGTGFSFTGILCYITIPMINKMVLVPFIKLIS